MSLDTVGVTIAISVVWVAIIAFFALRRGLFRYDASLRVSVLFGFIILCVLVYVLLISVQTLISLVSVILPMVWSFVDNQLGQQRGMRRGILILKSATDYCKEVADSIREECTRRLPRFELKTITNLNEENNNEQRTTFANAVNERPHVIIIVPSPNNDYLVPTAVRAHKEGVQLITVDDMLSTHAFICNRLPPPIHIGTNFAEGGRIAAQAMLKALNSKGNVVIISGPQGSQPSQERKLAFVDEILRQRREVAIIDCCETYWNAYEARQEMTTLLNTQLTIHGVFCCNDKLALGVVEAMKLFQQSHPQSAIARPVIIGFDGIKEIYRAIYDGDVYASVEVETVTQGRFVVDQLERVVSKRNPVRDLPYPSELSLTEPRLLTRETILNRGYHV